MELNLPLWLYYVLGFPLLLGPLITIHELGHYLVGRWFGVHAEAFSVGFGKEIAGFTDRRGTRSFRRGPSIGSERDAFVVPTEGERFRRCEEDRGPPKPASF